MGKIKDYLNKPYTRGDVLKQTLWSVGLTAVMWGAYGVYSLYTDRQHYKDMYYKSLDYRYDPTEEESDEEI